jgi:fructose-bisphosphate aldolase class II
MRQLLDYAAEQQFAIPAFNVSNMEQVQAIMQAAEVVDSPVILQGSAGSRSYAGEPFLRHLILAAIEQYPHLPVVMHQDHGAEPAVCARSIQSGFSSVMMDGSLMSDMKTPSSFDYNVDVTRKVVEMAHACGVSVEGELGCLGSLETGMMGEEDGHGSDDKLDHSQLLTDPDEAVEFIRQTHVDALAVAIGTSHGAYKFSKPPTADVLASSVPQDWLQIINNYGGDIAQTYGVPVDEIVSGIKFGVRKVNIDTDLRMATTGAIRQYLGQPEHASDFDPRKFYKAATTAMQAICQSRYEAFGSAGHASKIKVISLEKMVKRYASGELSPKDL